MRNAQHYTSFIFRSQIKQIYKSFAPSCDKNMNCTPSPFGGTPSHGRLQIRAEFRRNMRRWSVSLVRALLQSFNLNFWKTTGIYKDTYIERKGNNRPLLFFPQERAWSLDLGQSLQSCMKITSKNAAARVVQFSLILRIPTKVSWLPPWPSFVILLNSMGHSLGSASLS